MRNCFILLSLFASLSGCNQIVCPPGTIERDGTCGPPMTAVDPGVCGPYTELQGDRCVPTFPPTVCEDGTTEAVIDPETGVTTCKGIGGLLPCGVPIACGTPTGSTKQTICGQLYNFEDGTRFEAAGAMGLPCDRQMPATSGPCALAMYAYDALAFASNPMTAQALPVRTTYLDECGRYKLVDIETSGTQLYLGIGVDDAGQPFAPTGVTVTSAVAVPRVAMTVTNNVEAFIVKSSTTQAWENSGGPPLSGGIYAPVFRAHRAGVPMPFENESGVTITKSGATIPTNDFYFKAAATDRTMIDTAATSTGANGTVLVTNASVDADGLSYNGQGGLGPGCRWELHAGASLPGIVFIQIFRKIDIVGLTCND
jgi:hypothetical protein